MSGRPVVVLAGWLGCQRKALRRYEQLYRQLGFDVLFHIATPTTIVDYTLHTHPILIPDQWPLSSSTTPTPPSMQDLAWQVLGQLHNLHDQQAWIFHGFSNGGCFLWDQMRRILMEKDAMELPAQYVLNALSCRTKGVVFDSCPAWFAGNPSALRAGLSYCSWQERLDVLLRFGPGVVVYDGRVETQQRNQRCQEFFQWLHEDPLDIPQLYLAGQEDPISDYQHVDELIRHRESVQKSPVMKQIWQSSPHCGHLKAHPKEYTEAIETFAAACLLRARL
jgi:pimeloyl-ACP methyl ester carboxylesterase